MPKKNPANYTGGRPKDESKLSTDPQQIRVRLRRSARRRQSRQLDERITRDVELLYRKPLSEWDVEELARGRPRNAQGNFIGGIPSWITPVIAREAKRRLLDETFGKMAGHVDQAIKVLGQLMTSEETDDKGKPIVDARTKLAAATFVIEHILGKPKAIIEVDAEDKAKKLLAMAIVLDDGSPQDEPIVLEGEFEEMEDGDDKYEDDE